MIGKGDRLDAFVLAPALIRAFREYRRWQLTEAERNPAMRDALSDPEAAYVLMTSGRNPTHTNSVGKILKWHAVKAGVAVIPAQGRWDAPGGVTPRVSPHAMRRAWATIALNDEEQPIDVVSEVLKHRDISTTRRHYAPTKSERAQAALVSMRV